MINTALAVILIVIIIGSFSALRVKDLLSSFMIFFAVGLCLSLTFLILRAPDLALIQIVMEIVFFAVLLRVLNLNDKAKAVSTITLSAYISIMFLLALLGASSFMALKELHAPGVFGGGNTAIYVVEETGKQAYLNIVSEIQTKHRAIDTFGELTALLTALIGSLALLRPIGKIK